MSGISIDERLQWESEQLERYVESCPLDTEGHRLVEITGRRGNPPDYYQLMYRCRGLVRDRQTGQLGVAINHQVELQLDADYPFLAPTIQVLTPVFHPNIGLGLNGGYVCLSGEYTPDLTLAELVRQVGEMIRLALYWETPVTAQVYAELQKFRDRLPIDKRPLPALAAARAPETAQSLRVELPGGKLMLIRNSEGHSLAEIAGEVALQRALPSLSPNGRQIHYKLRPKGGSSRLFVLESIVEASTPTLGLAAAPVQRFLGQVKAANPGVFDFAPETLVARQGRCYRLSFHVETFALAAGLGGRPMPVRTKYNEARLCLSGEPAHEQFSLTWLTPIFHPSLEQQAQLQVPVAGPAESDLEPLFRVLIQLLRYDPVSGLLVRNHQAQEWIEQNAARVEWLRQNTPTVNLPKV